MGGGGRVSAGRFHQGNCSSSCPVRDQAFCFGVHRSAANYTKVLYSSNTKQLQDHFMCLDMTLSMPCALHLDNYNRGISSDITEKIKIQKRSQGLRRGRDVFSLFLPWSLLTVLPFIYVCYVKHVVRLHWKKPLPSTHRHPLTSHSKPGSQYFPIRQDRWYKRRQW